MKMPGQGSVLREVSAGVVTACLTVPLCIGAGILAYAPLGPDHVARGTVAGLVCAIAGGLAAALLRRSSFVATFPTTPISVILASFVLALATESRGDLRVAAVAVTLCVALAGLWQVLFAASGLSRILRFVPHPVMGGFVSGVAVLIAWHQVPTLLGVRSLAGAFPARALLPHPLVTAFGAALLGTILLVGRLAPRAPSLLLGLLIGSVAFHAAGALAPGADLGTTVGALPSSVAGLWPVFDWSVVKKVLGTIALLKIVLVGSFTLALVATLDTFFALRTAQFLADIPVDPRRDVAGQGLANVVSALAGGLAVSTSLSVSMTNHRAGGRTRLSTIASAGTLLLGGLLFPSVVTRLPLVVLAAILVAVSLRLVDRWSLQVLRLALTSRESAERRRSIRDGAIVLAVFLATLLGEPVAGVAVGVGLSCVLFMVDMSRPVVSKRWDAWRSPSRRFTPRVERPGPASRPGEVVVLELEGVLFFGNSHSLEADLHALDDGTDLVILDCWRLVDVDTSGRAILGQAASRLADRGKLLVLAGMERSWPGGPRTFPSVDAALEWAENRLLDGSHGIEPFPERRVPRPGPAEISWFRENLRTVHFRAGTVLCRKGDDSDCMWILQHGSVSVRTFPAAHGLPQARLGPGSTVGEMGLLEGRPRSADVTADGNVEAWILSSEELTRVLVEEPRMGQALLALVAAQLAGRLRETKETSRPQEYVRNRRRFFATVR